MAENGIRKGLPKGRALRPSNEDNGRKKENEKEARVGVFLENQAEVTLPLTGADQFGLLFLFPFSNTVTRHAHRNQNRYFEKPCAKRRRKTKVMAFTQMLRNRHEG